MNLVQAISGSVGAIVSTSIVFPLDKFKARLQVGESVTDLIHEITAGGLNHLPELWHGARSRILESGASKFSYFYFYSYLSVYIETRFFAGHKMGTMINLIVGYFAAVLNNILTMPLQVTSTRIMVAKDKNNHIWKEGRKIVKQQGILGLWRGWGPSMILCINPAISFASFDQVKFLVLRSRGLAVNNSTLSALEAFFIGAAAKAVATLLTFPFIRVKTLMQVDAGSLKTKKRERMNDSNNNINLIEKEDHQQDHSKKQVLTVLLEIFRNEGAVGLYRGLYPQLFKGVAASAILFATKEKIAEGIVDMLL